MPIASLSGLAAMFLSAALMIAPRKRQPRIDTRLLLPLR